MKFMIKCGRLIGMFNENKKRSMGCLLLCFVHDFTKRGKEKEDMPLSMRDYVA